MEHQHGHEHDRATGRAKHKKAEHKPSGPGSRLASASPRLVHRRRGRPVRFRSANLDATPVKRPAGLALSPQFFPRIPRAPLPPLPLAISYFICTPAPARNPPMHCGRFRHPLSRRDMLASCASGFGAVALSALLAEADAAAPPRADPTLRGLHHRAKARNVIFLYMDGGPSQVDTFDPKPMLTKYDGKDPHRIFKVEPTQFDNVGKVMASPWKFAQHGKSGLWVSDLFPHLAKCADDLCVIRSMISKFPEHTSANYFLHTGSGLQGRPSMGAWVGYGLGSLNSNLPGFIVLNGGLIPPGGLDNFGSRLPARRLPGLGLPRHRLARRQHPPARTRREAPARQARPGPQARPPRRRAGRRPRRHRVGHRQPRDGLPHADGRPRTDGHQGRVEGDARRSTASTRSTRTRRPSAGSA